MGLPSCFGRESLEPSKHRDDFACNNDVFPHDNRFHAGVFGLKANMVAFLEEALDRAPSSMTATTISPFVAVGCSLTTT